MFDRRVLDGIKTHFKSFSQLRVLTITFLKERNQTELFVNNLQYLPMLESLGIIGVEPSNIIPELKKLTHLK